MSNKAGAYLGGIRTIEDLRMRCRIDACGCWEWAYSTSSNGRPSVSMLIDGKRTNMNGRRAALTLAGKATTQKNLVATAAKGCKNSLCVNPEHCRLVKLSELRKEMVRNATPNMRAAWTKNGRAQGHRLAKLTLDQVEAIRQSDKPAKELSQEFGTCLSNVHRIRALRSWRAPDAGLAANSVFNWRPAA